MPGIQQAKAARARKRGRGVRKRTDGAPRLVEPGGPGNRNADAWAIGWTERAADGKSRSRLITTGEVEETRARDALTIFNAERQRPPEQRAITIRKICDAYKEAKRAEAHSFQSLESALQPIIAKFGPLRPDEVKASNIAGYIAERSKEPRKRGGRGGIVKIVDGNPSKKTINNELMMFKTACQWAKDHDWPIDIPPIKKQKKANRVRKRVLSRAETGRLLRALKDEATPRHLRTFVQVALLTGQRSNAIRALKWEHVDFEEGMLWFTRARPDAPDNKRVQDQPMTFALEVALREAMDGALLHREKAAKRGLPITAPEYVIEYKQRPVGSLKTAWHDVLDRAGIYGVWIHDLRRTAATLARNSGRSNEDVALYLNDSEEITRRTYAHAAPALLLDMQRTIATIIEEAAASADDA